MYFQFFQEQKCHCQNSPGLLTKVCEFCRVVSWITSDYSGFVIGKGIDLSFDLFIPKEYSRTMRLMYVLHNYWKFNNNYIVYCYAVVKKIHQLQACGLLLEIIINTYNADWKHLWIKLFFKKSILHIYIFT